MKSYLFNARLLVWTISIACAITLAIMVVHSFQMKRHAKAQLVVAEVAEEEGNYAELIEALHRYLSFDGSNADVHKRYANALITHASSTRERWKALQILRQVLTRKEAAPDLRVRAARLALELNEPLEAAQYLEPLVSSPEATPAILELAARCQILARKNLLAVEYLEKALEKAPDQLSSAELLSDLYRNTLHQSNKADVVLYQFVKNNPRLAAARILRARNRLAANQLVEAGDDLAAARKLEPNNDEALQLSAEVARRRGLLEEACTYLAQAIQTHPELPQLYPALALTLEEAGRLGPAVETLREGHRLHPNNLEITFELANLLVSAGKESEAANLSKSLPEDEARGRRLYLEGRLLQQKKEWVPAAKLYVEAIQAPDITPPLGSRLMLDLARCYGGMGARDEQFLATMQAARLSRSPRARVLLSELLLVAGRGKDALPVLRALAEMPAPPRDTWGLLARAMLEEQRTTPKMRSRWRDVDAVLQKMAKQPDQAIPTAVMRAELLLMQKRPQEARELLEATLKEHPGEITLYLALADLAFRQKNKDEVRQALQRGDAVLGNRIDWLLERARRVAQNRDGDSYQAMLDLEKRKKDLPPEPRDQLDRLLADQYARMGRLQDAARLSRDLLNRHPNDIQARLHCIDALLERRELPTAARAIEDLKQLEGEQGVGWRSGRTAYLLRKAQRGDKEALEEARTRIKEIETLRPAWSQTSTLAGRLAEIEGRPDAAISSYQQAIAFGDVPPAVIPRLLHLLSKEKRWNEALRVVDQARRQGQMDPDLLRPAAMIAQRAGKRDLARELAHEAVPSDSRSYRDLLWLGKTLEASQFPMEAMHALEDATRIAPQLPDAWLARIEQLMRLKRTTEAQSLLDSMKREVAPDHRELAVADGLALLGQYREAEKSYRDILQKNPTQAEALSRLANLLMRLNQPLEAESVLYQLLNPKVALAEEERMEIRRQLALALTAPEQSSDRVSDAQSLLDINKQLLGDTVADQRVRAFIKAWYPEQRAAALQTLNKLPGGPAVVPEEQLRLARLLESQNDWPGARRILLTLIAEDSNNPGLISALIDGLLRNKKKAEAAQWISRLEKVDPRSPWIKVFQDRLLAPKPR